MVFIEFCGDIDALHVLKRHRSRAASFHLLVITAAFDIAHKHQNFQWFDVRPRRNHVHSHGDSGKIFHSELLQHRFWVFFASIGYFFAKLVFLPKFLSDNLDNVFCMAVRFGKNQSFRHFKRPLSMSAVGEHFGQCFLKFFDNCPNLARIHDVFVELFARVFNVFIHGFPDLFSGESLAFVHHFAHFYLFAVFRNARLNRIDIVRHENAVGNRLFVFVFTDDILIEITIRPIVGRGGQTDLKGIKILQYLFPKVVNAAVTFVNDDKIKKLHRHFFAINDG